MTKLQSSGLTTVAKTYSFTKYLLSLFHCQTLM